MNLKKITSRILGYNCWANERITSFLATLDQRLLYRETGSSFGTIDRTMQHLVASQTYWYDIIFRAQINDFNKPDRINVVEEVIADLVAGSKQLLNSLETLSEEQLSDVIQVSDSTQSRYEYILHIFNHGSYHRGQIVSMCRALKVTAEIPVTDYDAYLWWIENELA